MTTSWGEIYLDPQLGRCYERNQAWAIGDADGLSAEAIDADLDRLFAAVGLGHRQLTVEAEADRRLAEPLAALGYGATTHRYMALQGAAPAAPRADVVEVDIAVVAAGNEVYLRTDAENGFALDEAVRAHLVEHHRTYGSAGADERCFAVVDGDGAAQAWAKLWTRDGVAQVEDVVCLAQHRGRGFGRDVAAAATRAALATDPELLFLIADDADWPKELYGRLGYASIGTQVVHVRHAPKHQWNPR